MRNGFSFGPGIKGAFPPNTIPSDIVNNLTLAGTPKPNCATMLSASWGAGNGEILTALTVQAADNGLLYQEAKRWTEIQQRAKQDEMNKANSKRTQAPL